MKIMIHPYRSVAIFGCCQKLIAGLKPTLLILDPLIRCVMGSLLMNRPLCRGRTSFSVVPIVTGALSVPAFEGFAKSRCVVVPQ